MGLMYSRLRQCCGKIKQSPQGSEYRQVSQVVPSMELGGMQLETDLECTIRSSSNSVSDGWITSQHTAGGNKVGIAVDRHEPPVSGHKSSPCLDSCSVTPAFCSASLPYATNDISSHSQPSSPPARQPLVDPPSSFTPTSHKFGEETAEAEADFFSHMGMGISYAAPKRAMANKLRKSEPGESVKSPHSAAFTMDNLLPDTLAISGWGVDSALVIDIPQEKLERKTHKKRPVFASAVEIDNDIELDF